MRKGFSLQRVGSLSNMASVVNSYPVNVQTISPLSSDKQVSDAWHKALQARLSAQETIHASLETNLDEQLNYARRLILLTNQRIVGLTWPDLEFYEYPYSEGIAVHQRDHAGIGCI